MKEFKTSLTIIYGMEFYGMAILISTQYVKITAIDKDNVNRIMIRFPTYDAEMEGEITDKDGNLLTFTFDWEKTNKNSKEALYYYLERSHNWNENDS